MTRDRTAWSATTANAREGQRRNSWYAALESFTSVQDLTVADEEAFSGKLAARRFADGVLVVDLAAQPNALLHCADLKSEDAAVFAMVFVSGSARIAQGDRSVEVGAGDVVLRGSRLPTALELTSASHAVGIFIPSSRFRAAGLAGLSDANCPLKVASVDPLAATMGAMFTTVASRLDVLEDRSFCFVEQAIVDLAWGCIAAQRESGADLLSATERRWNAAASVIEARLSDPDLRIADVARILGCSVRWLQRIFATQGTNFERYLLGRRLDHARRALLLRPAQNVTDVGLDCGFNDAGHFSRSFKQRFGLSPSQFRRPT